MNESRKQDMSYLFLRDITPAHENRLIYDPFRLLMPVAMTTSSIFQSRRMES